MSDHVLLQSSGLPRPVAGQFRIVRYWTPGSGVSLSSNTGNLVTLGAGTGASGPAQGGSPFSGPPPTGAVACGAWIVNVSGATNNLSISAGPVPVNQSWSQIQIRIGAQLGFTWTDGVDVLFFIPG